MKHFVLGDIHGSVKALLQCFERSNFDKDSDELIVLGDVCDGFPFVKDCINLLLELKHCIFILGNHDYPWALEWMTNDWQGDIWTSQGGKATMLSYGNDPKNVPKSHIEFIKNGNLFFVNENNQLFVHGGIEPTKPMKKQHSNLLLWDRSLIEFARKKHNQKPNYKYGGFSDIFVGHTTTQCFNSLEPLHFCNVWNLDTGAGWNGKLTIMNIETKEYWQSDLAKNLYLDLKGRE